MRVRSGKSSEAEAIGALPVSYYYRVSFRCDALGRDLYILGIVRYGTSVELVDIL